MASFIGDYTCKADSKCRVVVPASFRRVMVASQQTFFVLRKNVFGKCIDMYPLQEWENMIAGVRARLNLFDPKHAAFFREFCRGTQEVEMDTNGRILLPRKMLDEIGIDKEMVLAAQDSMIQVWQGGVYLDLTFGGGGHSGEILKRLDAEGCLLGFDQDEDALANVPEDDRFIFVNHNFRYLRNFMRYYGYEEADGILADLGVSSHEFDEAGRGFSFRFEAELDMRMNQRSKLTAATVLNTYDAEQLTAIFRNYGEVENARRLVDLIVKARANQEIKTSEAFYQIILPCIPKLKEKKYLAKVYQALRIEVNGELEALEEMMQQAMEVLKPGGRLVIITYHSLEDRIVKNFLKAGNAEGKLEKDLVFGHVHHNFELVNRKVIVPSEEEIVRNPRARSAKLRIARKKD